MKNKLIYLIIFSAYYYCQAMEKSNKPRPVPDFLNTYNKYPAETVAINQQLKVLSTDVKRKISFKAKLERETAKNPPMQPRVLNCVREIIGNQRENNPPFPS